MSVITPAGPSRSTHRPLNNPARLNVAARDPLLPLGGTNEDDPNDALTLLESVRQRQEVQRRADRWIDKMSEGEVKLDQLRKGLRHLHTSHYHDLAQERHLNGVCSYPSCPNEPTAPYSSQQRIRISTTKREIKQQVGNADEGFCSARCRTKSKWVEGQLEEAVWMRGSDWKVELPEDAQAKKAVTSPAASTARPNGVVPNGQAGPSSNPGSIADLVARLQIHERPTAPPTASVPSVMLTPPRPDPTSNPTPEPTSRRHAPSLIGPTPGLSSSIVSASRDMGPVPQMPPDDKEEEDPGQKALAWEKDMGLGTGDADDEDGGEGLWAMMQEAKELAEQESGG